MNKYDLNENEALEFAEKERDLAVNGLHSGTVIAEKEDGRHTLQLHWHPKNKQLVEVDTWLADGGEGDAVQEFSLMGVYEKVDDAIHLAAKYQ